MRSLVVYLFSLSFFVTAATAFASDTDKGASVFKKQCSSCHQVGNNARHRIGPSLNGIYGSTAGTQDGVKYSSNMKRMGKDGLIWTAETLDAYIENPRALVSKTRMNFRGIKEAEDRTHLLSYLRLYSDNPANIPEAEPTALGTDHDIDPAILAIQGDPEYGEYLASECLTCHQQDGTSDGIPSITLWPTEDFVVAMHAYKNKLRPHPVMQMMASRLNDEEIAALAAYFKDLE